MNVSLWPTRELWCRRFISLAQGKLLWTRSGWKDIEAIAALRRLLAVAESAGSLLLPAGLVLQWQAELRENGNILAPRFDPSASSGRRKIQGVSGLGEALEEPMLLVSRELARIEATRRCSLMAPPGIWLSLTSHAARRKKQEEGEFNTGTLLLDLVRRLQIGERPPATCSSAPLPCRPIPGTLGLLVLLESEEHGSQISRLCGNTTR